MADERDNTYNKDFQQARKDGHMADAADIDDFYNRVFDDDVCKFENVWGYLSKIRGGKWLERFDADEKRLQVRLQLKGIMVENETIQFFIPMMGRNRRADVYVFGDGKVNEGGLEYFTSVSGTFTCLDMEFAGSYDILVGPFTIVFERWEFDKMGNRLNGKGETKMCCSCR